MQLRIVQLALSRCILPGTVVTLLIAWSAVLFSPGGFSVITEFPPGSRWPWPPRPSVTPDSAEGTVRITLPALDQWRGAAQWHDTPGSTAIPIYPYGAFAGFPFRALCTQTYWGSWSADSSDGTLGVATGMTDWRWSGIPVYSGPDGWRCLPLRPLWLGLLADSAIWGGVWFATGHLIRSWIERRRTRQGRCPRCRHHLSGAARCPECGHATRGTA
jgi:hypothetical protein